MTAASKVTAKPANAESAAERVACIAHREKLLDDALAESFPASDPPSIARPADGRC